MATCNGVTASSNGKYLGAEDCVTQSLEHIALNALKQKAKQEKKGVGESILPNMAFSLPLSHTALPELHTSVGTLREASPVKFNQLGVMDSHSDATKTAKKIDTNSTDLRLDNVVLKRKTKTDLDSSASRTGVATGEKVAVIGGLQGAATVITSQERRDTTLHAAILSLDTDTNVMPPADASSKSTRSRAEREYLSSAALLTNESQQRTFTGENMPRGSENAFSGSARQSLQTEVMLKNTGTVVLNESSSESQLLYAFSDWGDGHQVNVQLGGHAKTPHVLHVSDPLVHQRLADYEGQGQAEPEWVFYEEEERPRQERKPQADEESV